MADVSLSGVSNVRALLGSISKPKIAGEALTVGQPVYLKSDDKVWLTDADVQATSEVLGIVVAIGAYGKTTAAAGDQVDVVLFGPIAGWDSLTPGQVLYASVTAGAIADAAPGGASGDFVFVVGFAWDAETIFVRPYTYDIAAQ